MRKIENILYKKFFNLIRLWKRKKLKTPFDELLTYDNYMSHGHLYYFMSFKNNNLIKKHMDILMEFLPNELFKNLEEAYNVYFKYIKDNENKKMNKIEVEKIFMKVDEYYYLHQSEMVQLIFTELCYCSFV